MFVYATQSPVVQNMDYLPHSDAAVASHANVGDAFHLPTTLWGRIPEVKEWCIQTHLWYVPRFRSDSSHSQSKASCPPPSSDSLV